MILSPENNLYILKQYHKSSKLLIPLFGISYFLNKNNMTPYSNVIDSINILNIGFHSYVSTSCIIGDYVKPHNIQKMIKFMSLKSHLMASFGFLYYINKNYFIK
tara:strand:- start:1041 stop:1352 length:312 start_codon:yes stop_codon:yes gene_type:complete